MVKENIRIWESQAKKWNSLKLLYPDDYLIVKWLNKIKKSSKILDEGCGIGQFSITFAKKGHKVVGLDFSKTLIKTAKKNAKIFRCPCKFVVGDIRNLPFENNIFDVVISAGIVEHVKETKKCIKEISRVLKKKGILIIHVPHKISLYTLNKLFQKLLGLWKSGYEKSFTKSYFEKLLKRNGFLIKKFNLKEIEEGSRFPLYTKILKILDAPFYQLGFGGHHMFFYCIKK